MNGENPSCVSIFNLNQQEVGLTISINQEGTHEILVGQDPRSPSTYIDSERSPKKIDKPTCIFCVGSGSQQRASEGRIPTHQNHESRQS